MPYFSRRRVKMPITSFHRWQLCLFMAIAGLPMCGCANGDRVGGPIEPDTSGETSLTADQAYDRARVRSRAYERTHGSFVDGPNGRIHVLQWGRTGTPLVWLHGAYSTAYEFATLAEQLADRGQRVIAVDWYAHGKTPLPNRDVSPYEFAEDLAGVLDELGISSAVIGGWSRGGMLAAFFL